MPPISPQGSRTGLVTALVIFVILFVTSTILYIYENAERRNLQERVAETEKRQGDLFTEQVVTSGDVTRAIEEGKAANPPATAMEHLINQRRQLAQRIAAGATSPEPALRAADQAVARLKTPELAASVQVAQTAPLADVVNALANAVAQLQQERSNLNNELAAANARTQQVTASRDQMLKERDQQIAAASAEMQRAMQDLAAQRQRTEQTVAAIQTTTTNTLGQAQQTNTQLEAQYNQANATIQTMQKQLDEALRRLKGIRAPAVEATIQKADGQIVRVPTSATVVINRGIGDQIVQGMTFEVYDQTNGIPALGDDGARETDMPVGKASIEVIRLGPGYSECRVIRRSPGQALVQGDLIANLVYDPTQKYNFVVYGNFDLDNNRQASPADADVIRRLVTQWGGQLMNEVNINTDFVVMGVEPTAEPIGEDDDAVERQRKLEAQQALDRYLEVRRQAQTLNVPILNQNRFLNFVGYRSQATR